MLFIQKCVDSIKETFLWKKLDKRNAMNNRKTNATQFNKKTARDYD